MHVFILNIDGSVSVVDAFNDEPHYVNTNYQKGQIFKYRYTNSREYWDCLHRDIPSRCSSWVYAHKVPDAIKMAALIVN
jgi:hypothetical protein